MSIYPSHGKRSPGISSKTYMLITLLRTYFTDQTMENRERERECEGVDDICSWRSAK